jgi:hypothetical protein
MILEISNNNIFKKLFELFQSFKFYKRGIDSSLSSVFSNLCVYTPSTWPTNNNRTCIPYLTEYSQKAKYFYPLLKNGPDLHELIALEIEIKFEQIVNRFGSFQAEMYRLNFQSINVVEEGLTDIYALSNGENGINLIINSSGTNLPAFIKLSASSPNSEPALTSALNKSPVEMCP